ncbi:MAG: hypothetical protein ACI9U2_003472 [Bradymonadia bacterium]|jgi:hypothetical protein
MIRILAAAISLLSTAAAIAQPAVTTQLTVDNLDGVGGQLDAVWRVGEHRLGVMLRGSAVRERFVGGYVVDEGISLEGRLTGDFTLRRVQGARFGLGVEAGARQIMADTATVAGDTSLAPLVALRPAVTSTVSSNMTVRLGVRIEVAMAVDPEVEVDMQATPLEAGVRWWFADTWALAAEVGVGGSFGYDGDGAKHILRGGLGLTYAPRPTPVADDEGGIGLFVSLEWRGMALADHLSHGPGFAVGVSLLDGWLKLGLAGLNRPGPLNPKTFDVAAADGRTYKGDNTLTLRSDGGALGLLAAVHIPITPRWAIEVPVTVGLGGFGFYLSGEDRDTPDGRRVSEWENELLDGRDASFGITVDGGVRAMYTPESVSWLRPYVGVNYTTVVGYDAFVRSSYDGFSLATGIEVGIY